MSEHHSHEHHDHSSHEHIPQDKKILALSFAIITGFMIVEFIGGYWFNSLALMADAGHMANDSLSLFLALLALFLSTQKQRYIALLNSSSLIVVALMILVEAIQRWQNPIEMMALPMLGVASLGLLVNLFVAKIMLNSDHDNPNIKAAYLHVLTDLFGSIIAMLSGLSAYLLGWLWVDPLASMILSVLVLKSGIGAFRLVLKNT
ncbi:MAG: cation diffusion facilitator family transporter [Haemophilus parainfluenzae]|jgi:cation diffusion facilitator family transporter|uniref:Cadmium, cobalt and zinc/H(+)-K(+) antiporter domain protein n=1 Tax=Haemophilus parainfluenzae HK2019 TaxID=1095746 RepID=A0ABN0EV59_HAEPA|nr:MULTISPECIES: cation diffusion facilitator family transporter [Haemophilus]EIF41100.1 cadmium, cobalt and zinc/H(+)-K(+) antiporter domain protein [Haemophilus parainfluenzae HK262]EIJ30410.1 cadmium, cobalt and zinc/H(+)-K(+) antiporter domain protein [Haemophilus parainfluenzae HK2019]MBS5085929.1 cation transporter [Haemophilus parainfluenzae]MBS7203081.1 cation transporter [Haemophilus parainfluenzae]MDU1944804.1 cation diffusion facilitator family transporter [Haemophilus parainfluenza